VNESRGRLVLRLALALLLALVLAAALGLWQLTRQPSLELTWLRPALQQWLSGRVGMPVQIGTTVLRRDGDAVIAELRALRVGPLGAPPLLEASRLVLRWKSASRAAWNGGPQTIEIDAPRIELTRGRDGLIRLGGVELGGSSVRSAFAPGPDFEELRVHVADLRWVDAAGGGAPPTFTDVELRLRRAAPQWAAEVAATPPAPWGGRVSASARWRGPSWDAASASVDVQAPRVDLQQWRSLFALPAEADAIEPGSGRLELHAEFDAARLARLRTALDLDEVDLAEAPHRAPLRLRHVQLQADYRPETAAGGEATLVVDDLAFDAEGGRRWPRGHITLGRSCAAADARPAKQPVAARSCRSSVRADALDLGLLADIALHLPLAVALHERLLELRPQGQAREVALRWDGDIHAPSHVSAHAELSALSLAPGRPASAGGVARPGLEGARVNVDIDDDKGTLALNLAPGTISVPGWLADPVVPLDAASASLHLRLADVGGGWPALREVQVDSASFANADASGSFSAHWQAAAEPAGSGAGPAAASLDLDGRLHDVNVARLARYLPLRLPQSLRSDLSAALLGGSIRQAAFSWHGAATVAAPAEAWLPPGLVAQADIDGVSFDATPFGSGAAHWPTLTSLAGHVTIDAAGLSLTGAQATSGPLLIQRVQGRLGSAGPGTMLEASGAVHGPVSAMAATLVAIRGTGTPLPKFVAGVEGMGDLTLALRIPIGRSGAAEASGKLAFADLALRPLPGWPAITQVAGTASFDAQGIRLTARAADFLGGPLQVAGGRDAAGTWRLTGEGTAAAAAVAAADAAGLPKAARGAFAGQLRYGLALDWTGAQSPRIDLHSDLVGLAVALPYPLAKTAEQTLPLHVAGDADDAWRVQLGTLAQGCATWSQDGALRASFSITAPAAQAAAAEAPCQPPSHGVQVRATLDRFDLAAWQQALRKLAPGAAQSTPPGHAQAEAAPAQRDLHIEVGSLRWHDVDLGHLILASSGSEAARQVTLDLRAGKSVLVGKARCGPDARAAAPGTRVMPATEAASAPLRGWTFALSTDDAGALLERLGWHDAMLGGQGSIRGEAPCAPWFDPAGYSGRMELALTKGTLPAIKPGVARLLGALSLRSLNRRLKGDLADLEHEGFTFDSLDGPLTLSPGLILGAQLQLKAPDADATIDGRIALSSRTQDLHLVVMPTTDLGAASLGYALVNPALGLGSLAAQYLLHKPLAELTRREYRICGSWHDPQVRELGTGAASAPALSHECSAIASGAAAGKR